MRNAALAEWVLARGMRRDRAAAIAGDLLETAETGAGFWICVLKVLAAAAWRRPVAWITAYAVGGFIFRFVNQEILLMTLRNHQASRLRTNAHGVELAGLVVLACVAIPLWFLAPYLIVRFGWRDRTSRLAMVLGGVATVGVVVLRFAGTAPKYFGLGCAVAVAGIVLGALIVKRWRRSALVLVVTHSVGIAGTVGLATLMSAALDHYPAWGHSLRRVVVQVSVSLMVLLLTSACSRAYRWLRGSEGGRLGVV